MIKKSQEKGFLDSKEIVCINILNKMLKQFDTI